MRHSGTRSVEGARLSRVRRSALRKADGLLVTHLPNVRYLAGFTGSYGVLALDRKGCSFFTAGLYRTQVREEVRGADVRVTSGDALGAAVRWLVRRRCRRILYEAGRMTVQELRHVERITGDARLLPSTGAVENIRAVKDREEVGAIRASQLLAARVFQEILPLVRPGVSELDLAAEIDHRMRRHGAQGPSFDTIVASGPRSALPHGRPTGKRLRDKELVVFDLGAILGGYCSDMTRTVFLGTPSARIRRLYRAVRDALERAREAVRAGAGTGDVDAAARRVLTRRGFGRYFVHSTGHGLGLEVHEDPSVRREGPDRLKAGNVITLEPGAYLPGVGGVRIEDVVVVRRNRAETLTPVTTELVCL